VAPRMEKSGKKVIKGLSFFDVMRAADVEQK
jgi:hypothetical protein